MTARALERSFVRVRRLAGRYPDEWGGEDLTGKELLRVYASRGAPRRILVTDCEPALRRWDRADWPPGLVVVAPLGLLSRGQGRAIYPRDPTMTARIALAPLALLSLALAARPALADDLIRLERPNALRFGARVQTGGVIEGPLWDGALDLTYSRQLSALLAVEASGGGGFDLLVGGGLGVTLTTSRRADQHCEDRGWLGCPHSRFNAGETGLWLRAEAGFAF